MSKRYYKPQSQLATFPDEVNALPTNLPIAVYYRQSTEAQVGNISTSIQTVDMVAYLRQRGWAEDSIYLIDMDEGVSGTTRIDERPGMRLLFDLITQRKIGAVACQDEDRLFRDVTQIQVNIFIEACRTAKCLVITPNMIYDFANELTGSFHARQFRFKSEMAAEYIDTVIRGKLHRAKRRLMMEGRWAGFIVVPGYMVDMRKHLPDGGENPEWRRYVPFQEYADVVNEYFRLLISYAGNVHATVKHIHQFGPYYPDPSKCKPQNGHKFVTRMRKYGYGYCPARNGLVNLLTNATVIGHWAVNGIIVRWNNHPPIVEEGLFWKAFNYLSPVTLDGRANPHYRPYSENARPSLDKNRPVERPLCAGIIVSKYKGKWKNVGTVWIKDREEYVYMHTARYPHEVILWRRNAYFIDRAIVTALHERLRATFEADVWQETLAQTNAGYEEEKRRISTQLATLERVMQNQILGLETIDNPNMIRAIQERYEEAEAEHKRLSDQLAATISQSQRIIALEKIKNTYDPTLNSWDSMTRDEKRLTLHTFIDRIEAIPDDGSGLRLTIKWVDGDETNAVLPKQMKNGWRTWLESETNTLLQLVEVGASQVEIAATFPSRTWKQIMDKIASHLGSNIVEFSIHPMREGETYSDFAKRAINLPPVYQAGSADRWTRRDVEQLRVLSEQGADRLTYLKTFPHRNWLSISKKLSSIVGDVPLPFDHRIRNKDSFATFIARFPYDQAEDASPQSASISLQNASSCLLANPIEQAQQKSISSDSGPQSTPGRWAACCSVLAS